MTLLHPDPPTISSLTTSFEDRAETLSPGWCEECEADTFTLMTQRTVRLGKRGPPTFEGNVRLATTLLRQAPRLYDLGLGNDALAQAVVQLCDAPLRALHLNGQRGLEDAAVESVAAHFPALRVLGLNRCERISIR